LESLTLMSMVVSFSEMVRHLFPSPLVGEGGAGPDRLHR
jgi:hypothetical protein